MINQLNGDLQEAGNILDEQEHETVIRVRERKIQEFCNKSNRKMLIDKYKHWMKKSYWECEMRAENIKRVVENIKIKLKLSRE